MLSKIIDNMIMYFSNDVKRINHAMKVFSFAKTIAECEGVTQQEQMIIELSAVLHDIGIKEAERKYRSSEGKYQEIEGPPIAEAMLAVAGIDKPVIERVSFLIANHHSYSRIDNIDFQILVEADFIVNIFEDIMDTESIDSIQNKYFKTLTGKKLLETMYKNRTEI